MHDDTCANHRSIPPIDIMYLISSLTALKLLVVMHVLNYYRALRATFLDVVNLVIMCYDSLGLSVIRPQHVKERANKIYIICNLLSKFPPCK